MIDGKYESFEPFANKQKPCLVVVFNHRFEQNLPKLRELYRDRFEHVHYLMPFYQGNEADVSAVFESSGRFQGYFAQGLSQFRREGVSHYIFVADDLLLDPTLNDSNILAAFGAEAGVGYIKELIPICEETFDWPFLSMALKACRFTNLVNAREELPDREEAFKRFAAHHLSTRRLGWRNMPRIERHHFAWSLRSWVLSYLLIFVEKNIRDVVYPMVRAYADLAIVPADDLTRFCHFCGVFAAMGIFVECAIPTALLLAVDDIRLERDLPRSGVEMLHPPGRAEFEEKHRRLLSHLLQEGLPDNALYIHPVKLSRWSIDDNR